MINVNMLSDEAIMALLNLDNSFIGTKDYIGLAYFWAHEYRHYLRDASSSNRRLVHKKLLEAGLKVDEVSDKHEKIINRYSQPKF